MAKDVAEFEALKTWDVVPKASVPEGKRVLPSTWAMRVKRHPDEKNGTDCMSQLQHNSLSRFTVSHVTAGFLFLLIKLILNCGTSCPSPKKTDTTKSTLKAIRASTFPSTQHSQHTQHTSLQYKHQIRQRQLQRQKIVDDDRSEPH